MKKHSFSFWIGLLCATTRVTLAADPHSPEFETDVRPILKAQCWQCHGETEELKGGLDARLARFLLTGGESGPAIVPGKHAGSLLYERVSSGEMPPGAKVLSAKDIAILARWIDTDTGAGTVRPEPQSLSRKGNITEEERQHWSFQPVSRPGLPDVRQKDQVRSPIDAFLLARLEAEGVGFSRAADRQTLVRRLFFDLMGLPPTPGEVRDLLPPGRPARTSDWWTACFLPPLTENAGPGIGSTWRVTLTVMG